MIMSSRPILIIFIIWRRRHKSYSWNIRTWLNMFHTIRRKWIIVACTSAMSNCSKSTRIPYCSWSAVCIVSTVRATVVIRLYIIYKVNELSKQTLTVFRGLRLILPTIRRKMISSGNTFTVVFNGWLTKGSHPFGASLIHSLHLVVFRFDITVYFYLLNLFYRRVII
jgi:hypothetical protein